MEVFCNTAQRFVDVDGRLECSDPRADSICHNCAYLPGYTGGYLDTETMHPRFTEPVAVGDHSPLVH